MEGLTKKECEVLLEAIVNWMGDGNECWTDEGKAVEADYQAIIDKLQARIALSPDGQGRQWMM